MNEFLEGLFYSEGDGGSGRTDGADGADGAGSEGNVGEPTEPFKVFQTEEDYNKEIKSAESRGKFSILQKLEVKSIDEVKEKLNSTTTLQNELTETKNKYNQLTEDYSLHKANVAENYKEEVKTLAKSKMAEGVDFDTALKQVVEKMPFVTGKAFKGVVGRESSTEGNEETQVKEKLAKKYP